MSHGEKTGGRVAGTPNKVSATVKDNLIAVFNRLDGTAGMAEWAQANKTDFYKLYAKLLPTQAELSGPDGGKLHLELGLPWLTQQIQARNSE